MCMDMRTHHQNRDPTVVAQCQSCTVYNLSGVVVASGVANVIIEEIVLKQCYLNSFVHPVDKSNDLHTKIFLTSGKECVDFWAFSKVGVQMGKASIQTGRLASKFVHRSNVLSEALRTRSVARVPFHVGDQQRTATKTNKASSNVRADHDSKLLHVM